MKYAPRVSIFSITLLLGCWSEQQTQLLICSVDNDIECVRGYLSNGADVNGKGKEGVSPFYAAIKNHNFEVADVFNDYGVDLNKGFSGKSYLEILIMENNHKAIKYLFDNGAEFHKDSVEYKLAVESKNERIIDLFEK